MPEIKLVNIMNLGDPSKYKLHLGCRNPDGEHPLDLYIEDNRRGRTEGVGPPDSLFSN
jgi:hypothetical protein